MNTVTRARIEFEELHDLLIKAIADRDMGQVESLVIRQCSCVQQIGLTSVSEEERAELREMVVLIQRQQALIAQSLFVANYFLNQVQQATSFIARA